MDERLKPNTAPVLVGILNVTPDSFHDGGHYLCVESAIQQGHLLIEQGADVIDIGGESTRPGATKISAQKESERVLEVIQALSPYTTISIDTTKPLVAQAAREAGATILNDVQGLKNPTMMELSSDFDEVVVMHSRGTPKTMGSLTQYTSLLDDIRDT